jgi:dehydrogenase/reductase SDR family protein 12
MTLATHVIGPNLLTRLLIPRLQRSADARVVFVTSGGMYTQRRSLEDLEWRHRPYDGVTAYAQTKRMQVVLTEQLARALGPSGITVNAMHPGWADTPSVRHALPRFWQFTQHRLRTAAEAADTVTWLAASDAARGETGGLWFDRARRTTHLLPWTRETRAQRDAFAALLNDSMTNTLQVSASARAA